jgi:LAO/AO transport system kinase
MTRAEPSSGEIASRILAGDERALARLLSALEDGDAWGVESLKSLRAPTAETPSRPQASSHVIGVTGPPGSGKSTLVDKLISAYRGRGERVGVLAVDPSSPFSGGALLGDRIRMQGSPREGRAADPGLFIRSLASRGRLGGLSRASAAMARALEAAGYGLILVETVGIGQSEVDIARLADTVVLVAMPSAGDDIQTIKAGVMEIGDIFVVNKADREGADRAVRELRSALGLSRSALELRASAVPRSAPEDRPLYAAHPAPAPRSPDDDLAPVLKTTASTGEGVSELVTAIDARRERLIASGEFDARRRRGAMAEARFLLSSLVLEELESLEGGLEEELAGRMVRGEVEAAEAAALLFDSIRKGGKRA